MSLLDRLSHQKRALQNLLLSSMTNSCLIICFWNFSESYRGSRFENLFLDPPEFKGEFDDYYNSGTSVCSHILYIWAELAANKAVFDLVSDWTIREGPCILVNVSVRNEATTYHQVFCYSKVNHRSVFILHSHAVYKGVSADNTINHLLSTNVIDNLDWCFSSIVTSEMVFVTE